MDENKFTIQNENGEEIECEILFTFTEETTGKNYIAYTDDSLDEEGNTNVYASTYDPDSDPFILQPIETEEEWEMIERVLSDIQDADSEDELAELEGIISDMLADKSDEELAELKELLSAPLDDDEE